MSLTSGFLDNTNGVLQYHFTTGTSITGGVTISFGIANYATGALVNFPTNIMSFQLFRTLNNSQAYPTSGSVNPSIISAITGGGGYTLTIPQTSLTASTSYFFKITYINRITYFSPPPEVYIGYATRSLPTTATALKVNPSNSNNFYCLFEDTEVLTPSGYVSVKSLQEGDLVTTSDGRSSHIKRIWSSNMPLQEQYYPMIILANSIAENYPPKDCRLSKWHLINFNGNWIGPYKNEHIFKYDRDVKSIKYYHLELENYFTDHLVINGGLVVESLGNGQKDTGDEWDTRVKNSIIL